jgi:fructose-1,6-bisphosphatase/inositol monophosphatase family enzyme
LDLAIEAGEVIKPKNARFQLVDKATGEMIGEPVKEADTQNEAFLGVVLKRQSFKDWVRENFMIAQAQMVADED